MSNDEKQELIRLLEVFSLQSGKEFTLASGVKSTIYCDVKKTALNGHSMRLLAKLLYNKMLETFGTVEAVAGVVLGGCHLASIVAMHSNYDMDVIYVRKEAKDHGTQKLIERPYMMEEDYVVIIEDVVTTGTSALAAARLLEKEGFKVVGILAVVDRRVEKTPHLTDIAGAYSFAALVNFEELKNA